MKLTEAFEWHPEGRNAAVLVRNGIVFVRVSGNLTSKMYSVVPTVPMPRNAKLTIANQSTMQNAKIIGEQFVVAWLRAAGLKLDTKVLATNVIT